KIEDVREKIRELVHVRIKRVDKEKFKIDLSSDGVVTIELPPEAFTYEGLQYAKRGIAIDISRYIPGVSAVKFIETYTLRQAKAERKEEEGGQEKVKEGQA
ncbi:MAG: hypothetical protein QXS67_03265, partial [Candidatus Nezhaarchaeales archaeon]